MYYFDNHLYTFCMTGDGISCSMDDPVVYFYLNVTREETWTITSLVYVSLYMIRDWSSSNTGSLPFVFVCLLMLSLTGTDTLSNRVLLFQLGLGRPPTFLILNRTVSFSFPKRPFPLWHISVTLISIGSSLSPLYSFLVECSSSIRYDPLNLK